MIPYTPISLPPPQLHIKPSTSFFVIGSCFSEHISARLAQGGFTVCANPFGTLFNPASIAQGVSALLNEVVNEAWVYEGHEGSWHSTMHSTLFSAATREACLENIHQHWAQHYQSLKNAQVVMVTFGTAHVYVKNHQVVANCHKQPAKHFQKRRLSVAEIVAMWQETLTALWAANPNAQVLFTVSPFRYMNEDTHEGTLTKAILHLAIDELMQWNNKIVYFPSYEIIMDELRDYRFYDTDMLHISEQAAEYVWKRFADWSFAPNTWQYVKEYQALQKALNHKPRDPLSPESIAFKAQTLEKLKQLKLVRSE